MRTVLVLYLRNQLHYGEGTSTAIYHAFMMLAYFFPLFGQILLSLSAAPPIGLSPREFSMVGLLLIAIGTGGIKPCVSAFGGDQFVLPQQERYLSTFFSIFYFSINFGSLISSFLTPVLRSNVSCFGDNSCYSLAFLVPAVLMIVSIVIFLLGRPLYRMVKPSGNVILLVSQCISHAIYKKATSKEKREHWLDHAEDQYEKPLIKDIKTSLQVMKLFIPIPIFWALFDQQGSRWTIQASRMNGEIGDYLLYPDQMMVVNPLLVLAFIPLFETCIYPLLAKIGLRTPLKKLTIGGLLAGLSFVVSALVELQLEQTYPVLPSQGVAQIRIFNTLNCPVSLTIEGLPKGSFELKAMDMWVDKYVEANGTKSLSYTADFSKCETMLVNGISQGKIEVFERNAISWAITRNGLSYSYHDSVEKSVSGDPLVRPLLSVDSTVECRIMNGDIAVQTWEIAKDSSEIHNLTKIKAGKYDIWIDNSIVQTKVPIKLGGVYTLVGYAQSGIRNVNVVTITDPNSLHILWLIPQYIIITMGEVMFSVTGLEFAFTQAPTSMKSLLQASWQLTVAVGNLIVVIVAEGSWFDNQASIIFFPN
ncbi:Peptide transporter family 1 [Dufourea novaeangliae]|uniref:Peptide transporter family 1 n=1 Tax=Dufourea novaeangliae TaxID=178035 RepID=A0A154P007_DUFNO|nr:Peptide transporter family 1 [Dufourea novaeangliae]